MITVPAGVRVLVATKPVDFRRGADSLAALVREQLKHDPFAGTIYIFRSKPAPRAMRPLVPRPPLPGCVPAFASTGGHCCWHSPSWSSPAYC